MSNSNIISPSYKKPITVALIAQVLIALLSSLTLDGGTVARICGIALVAFWGGVAVLIWRRPHNPTKIDLALIQLGYFLIIGLAWFLVLGIWKMRGQ